MIPFLLQPGKKEDQQFCGAFVPWLFCISLQYERQLSACQAEAPWASNIPCYFLLPSMLLILGGLISSSPCPNLLEHPPDECPPIEEKKPVYFLYHLLCFLPIADGLIKPICGPPCISPAGELDSQLRSWPELPRGESSTPFLLNIDCFFTFHSAVKGYAPPCMASVQGLSPPFFSGDGQGFCYPSWLVVLFLYIVLL